MVGHTIHNCQVLFFDNIIVKLYLLFESNKGPCPQMCSATTSSLAGMLTGRFLVGLGMGLGPAVAALYVAEVHDFSTSASVFMRSIVF